MPSMKRAGSILTVAALTASTALSAPATAFAQGVGPVRMAQAEPSPLDAPPEVVAPVEPQAPAPEAPDAPEPEAVPEAPAEAPPVIEEQAPAPSPEIEAQPVEAAPVEEPAAAPQPDVEPSPVPAPVEPTAPEAPAAPAMEAQPTDEPQQADDGIPRQPEPDFEQPGQPQATSEPETAVPAEPEAAPAPEAPVVAPDAVPAPAAPVPEVQPAPAPTVDPAPVAPVTPAPSAPVGEAAPAPAVPAAPTAPATPPAADPFTSPPVEGTPAPPVEASAPTAAPAPAAAPQPVSAEIQNAPVDPTALSRTDAQVQNLGAPVAVAPVRQERGERVREAVRPELPPQAQVVQRVGDRDVLAIVGAAAAGAAVGAAAGYFIRPDDETRLSVGSRERYEERLPRGRTRETIVRPDGTQVITVRDRYGDVVRRSRITPDDREVVLFYDPYDGRDEDGRGYVFDPGAELPPLRVAIPRERYVVDVSEPDEELYYETIVAPPVETVERIYSVDEVRRSARIRDKVRRIDLNTINFDFGKATISQSEVANLEALATAVSKVIRDNPGETFLIEGHTDAVGSNVANLALSDRRAEAVAEALTNFFGVPPENLVTQGYGEEQLKVATQGENRENRRVTLRRITALVKPVG